MIAATAAADAAVQAGWLLPHHNLMSTWVWLMQQARQLLLSLPLLLLVGVTPPAEPLLVC